jgi:hypothetical protein
MRFGGAVASRKEDSSMSELLTHPNQSVVADYDRLRDDCGMIELADVSRTHSLTLEQLLEASKTLRQPKEQEPPPPRTAMRRFVIEPLQALNMMLNSKTVQTLLYAAFVFTTQLVIYTLRAQEEYYLDKFYTDTLM